MPRTPPGSYDYASLPQPVGAAGLMSPVSPSRQQATSSEYDPVDQSNDIAQARRETRASAYSQFSATGMPTDSAPPTPVLQSGNEFSYPLRQQAVSPAPSYGAISPNLSSYPVRQNEPRQSLDAGRRRSMGTMASDPAASSVMLDKMGLQTDEAQMATLLRKEGYAGMGSGHSLATKKRGFWTRGRIAAAVVIFLIAAGVGIGIGAWQATKHHNSNSASANNVQNVVLGGQTLSSAVVTVTATAASAAAAASTPSSSATSTTSSTTPLWGGSGLVTALNGTVFNYTNPFGGTWCAIPFNDSARAQATSPPLDEPWDWSYDLMQGVNIGGWLITEPFINPELYQQFQYAAVPAVDEWTLMGNLGANASAVIANHYATFFTEQDFAEIAAAGLNWIRLPVPYWMIETYENEPFLEGVSWKYMQLALAWARKYGLRVELDLHTAPGSQNGLNHSGKLGSVNVLNGIMGLANVARTLNYVRTLAEFITQPQYRNVVQGFMVLNEPMLSIIGPDPLRSFYYQAYEMLRSVGGIGVGNGPMMFIHDGFAGPETWYGFLEGADRVAIESHDYFAFSSSFSSDLSDYVASACTSWAAQFNQSMSQFGFASMGEWSIAANDCGLYVDGVGLGPYYTGDCTPFTNYPEWTAATKQMYYDMTQAFQDATRNWAFWTWKIGVNQETGLVANPQWSYSLGLAEGWIPQNPRDSIGACPSLVEKYNAGNFNTYYLSLPLAPSMTGGVPTASVDPDQVQSYGAWPVTSLTSYPYLDNFPTYTATQAPITLSASAYPTSLFLAGDISTNVGNGWYKAADTSRYHTPVAGCSYPNPWSGVSAQVPATPCVGGNYVATGVQKRSPEPVMTPAPVPRHRQ